MPQYATSGTNSLTVNPVPPTVLFPGDDKYLFGTGPGTTTGTVAGVPGGTPTPGVQQNPNDSNVVYEFVAVGERSIAVQLAGRPGGGSPAGLMVQVFASANPGAAEIDVQDAAIDADGAYVTSSNTAYKLTTWTQVGGSGLYTAWAEFQPEGGRFISLKVIANPNGVNFIAKVSYI